MTPERRRDQRWIWRPDIRKDVDDELAFHAEMLERDFAAGGLPPAEAREAARRRLGDVTSIAATCCEIDRRCDREYRRANMWMDFRQDLAHAVRQLSRAPRFAVLAALTLALGIGATTAVFSLANWILLRPVPGVASPQDVGVVWSGRFGEGTRFGPSFVSYPNFADVSARLRTLSAIAGYQYGSVNAAPDGGAPRPSLVHFVSASYFDVLGARMTAGRSFAPEEDAPGSSAHVAVVSHRYWTSVLGRDERVLLRSLRINALPFRIIGVGPRGFHGPERVSDVDIWLPRTSSAAIDRREARSTRARREASTSSSHASRQGSRGSGRPQNCGPWVRGWPSSIRRRTASSGRSRSTSWAGSGCPPHPSSRVELYRLIGLMFGASVLVLLAACANVAGLLLGRGIGRIGECAVRVALGATRFRLVRQQATEGGVIGLLGGGGAVLVVLAAARGLDVARLVGLPVAEARVPIDWRVLVFAVAVSLVAGGLASVLPATRVLRGHTACGLRSGGPAMTRRWLGIGTALTVSQVSAALALLVGALLMTGTIRHVFRLPLGFDPSGLVMFRVAPSRPGPPDESALVYAREFERRLRALSGVDDVAVAQGAPFMANSLTRVRPHESPDPLETRETLYNQVASPTYFETLGIPLLRGRLFEPSDLGEPGRRGRRVVVLSRALAGMLFGSEDPVGRFVEFPLAGREKTPWEVVGVVGDVRYRNIAGAVEPMLYEPFGATNESLRVITIIVRAPRRHDIAADIQSVGKALNPDLPVAGIMTVRALLEREMGPRHVLAWLAGVLAAIASALSLTGVYATMTRDVMERRREFGIRVALGAMQRGVVGIVLRRAVVLTAAGLVIGGAAAAGLGSLLESYLVGVRRFDPQSWGAAVAALAAVALAASAVPALRAARVSVSETLRQE